MDDPSNAPVPSERRLLCYVTDWSLGWSLVRDRVGELADEGGNVEVIDLGSDALAAHAARVVSVPCFVVMEGDAEIARRTGALSVDTLREMVGLPPKRRGLGRFVR